MHHVGEHHSIIPVIQNLGLMNQCLIHQSLNLGLLYEAKQLQRLDDDLAWLLQKAAGFNFISAIADGKTLLVGEGNLSFALSIAKKKRINPAKLVASTYEAKSNLSEAAASNASHLRMLGTTVLHGVDATKLSHALGSWRFDNIAFQFPHVGSREPEEGRNPNFILIRDFLKSAYQQLKPGGQVLISAVDSPHYQGAFQFEEAGELAGFKPPVSYPFEPSDYPGYNHTMTNDNEGALNSHDEFRTWIFKR